MNEKTILLTATINTSYYGNVDTINGDVRIREKQYLDTCEKIIKNTDIETIILCDNTNYKLDTLILEQMAETYKKKFEYLTYVEKDIGNMKLYGKGYGEHNIIKYALENSFYLKNTNSFFKLTGRVWIKNLNKIINQINEDNENYFTFYNRSKCVNTVFFKVNTKDYIANFYQLEWTDNTKIEEKYYEAIIKTNINCKTFKNEPLLVGIRGGGQIHHTKLMLYK